MLKYKAEEADTLIVEVDKNGTTTECSRCHHYKPMTLADRVYHCDKCGLELDRDINSAINIKFRALVKAPYPEQIGCSSMKKRTGHHNHSFL